ncbi:PAS domain S-box protein [Desulfobacterales bacterium HSG17]|nr:PAS domain S-box protein [Desulfobacterales bacterium HSG17]
MLKKPTYEELEQRIQELEQAESELKYSKNEIMKFRAIADNAVHGNAIVDLDGTIVYLNDFFANVHGYAPDELIGKNLSVFHNEKQLVDVRCINENLINNGYYSALEVWHTHKDGTVFPMLMNAVIIYDDNDVPMYIGATGIDITKGKQAETALYESRSKLLRAQYIARMGDFTWELSSGAVTWSEGMHRLLKYDLNEKIDYAKVNLAIHHPDDLESVTKWLNDSIASGKEKIPPKEYRLVCKDGEVLEIHTEGQIEYKDGEAVRLFGTCQDITERKRVEQALRDEEKFIDIAIDSLPGIFYLFTREGKFLRWNQSFEEVSGYTTAEISTKHPLDFFPVEEQAIVEKRIGEVFTDGKSFVEANWLSKNGTKTLYYLTGVRVDIGGTLCQVGMGVDISERKRAEEEREGFQAQLLQAQKIESIGNLAGGIAHDFNNILFPIIGLAEMLMKDLPADSLEYENVDEIFQAGKRGSDLVKQILSFSRQTEHKMLPVKIQRILKEVLKLSRSTIPSNIDIDQDIQNDCGPVKADPTQMHQIVMNLITNAYHAVEQTAGKISVQLREAYIGEDIFSDTLIPGKYASISVSDTGVGITKDDMGRIFEPYFTTKEQGKGTGLGLAVVYGIIREHGGDIKLVSEVGKGTSFTVYLPLIEKPAKIIPSFDLKTIETGIERILLVDDELPIVKLEKMMLERLGYNVTFRTSSIEALEAFKGNPTNYDLVVTDMTMPNMTGVKLTEELIAIKPDIPIIICTGFSDRLSAEKAKIIGAKGLLMKPVVKAELAKMVRMVLDETKGKSGD